VISGKHLEISAKSFQGSKNSLLNGSKIVPDAKYILIFPRITASDNAFIE
jgi:hypothetical protein